MFYDAFGFLFLRRVFLFAKLQIRGMLEIYRKWSSIYLKMKRTINETNVLPNTTLVIQQPLASIPLFDVPIKPLFKYGTRVVQKVLNLTKKLEKDECFSLFFNIVSLIWMHLVYLCPIIPIPSLKKVAIWSSKNSSKAYISKFGDCSQGWPQVSLFDSYYTNVFGRALLLSLDCLTLPLIRTL